MTPSLTGKRVLITSGPTHAPIDAVRYISNRSSGRLGRRIVIEALALGARVTMVTGPDSALPTPDDVSEREWSRLRVRAVETVSDVLHVLKEELTEREHCDALIHAMAVLDYVPVEEEEGKVPSGRDSWALRLVRTPKVIAQIKGWSPRTFLVGFKLEVGKDDERLREVATNLMRDSRADLVVANDLRRIRDEVHPAQIVARGGNVLATPATKSEIARELCSALAQALS